MTSDAGSVANMLTAIINRPDDEEVEVFGCRALVIRERIKGFDGRWNAEKEIFSDQWRGVSVWLEIEGRR